MSISFTKPVNLDGAKLVEELEAAGIVVGNDKPFSKWPVVDGNDLIWLEIAQKDKAKAESVVAAHNG